MEGELLVASLALAVSLAALFISLSQVLQLFLGTVEGYRRCAQSVIGVWHTTRKRHFILSEFRFETLYTTPEVILASSTELEELSEDFENVFSLVSLDDEPKNLVTETVHPGSKAKYADRATWQAKTQWITKIWSAAFPRNPSSLPNTDLEKISKSAKPSATQRAARKSKSTNDLLVTWIELVSQFHQLYSSYWPDECRFCRESTEDNGETNCSGVTIGTSKAGQNRTHQYRSDIIVIYRRWSWDFWPPDVTRPLAKMNMGDVIVLAIRMGMNWTTLQVGSGRIQADGNGFNLSPTQVNGLGIVLRFQSIGRHTFRELIPSTTVDKLICGIISGDPLFVKQDFSLEGGKAVVDETVYEYGSLSMQIGLTYSDLDLARTWKLIEPHNEAVILLLPFLPLPGSTVVGYPLNVFYVNTPRKTSFLYWEGRYAYLRQLGARLDKFDGSDWCRNWLDQIHKKLMFFATNYRSDYYCFWDSSMLKASEKTQRPGKLTFLEECRKAYQFSSDVLSQEGLEFQRNVGEKTRYVHLVAAHISMTSYSIKQALNNLNRLQEAGKDLSQGYDDIPPEPRPFDFIVCEIATTYTKNINNPDHGIGKYLRKQRIELSDEQVEVAWWALVLRGISWSLSAFPHDIDGERISPALYGNKTPIWIT